MSTVNIHEAKTNLSGLLKKVERGEEVVIARSGRPVARLVRYEEARRIAPPGSMADLAAWIADDFDEPLDDLFECLEDRRDGSA